MVLPFLDNDRKWPISKEPEERTVNPSHDKQLEDHLIEELMIALEHKETSKLKESLMALIQHIMSQGDENAFNPGEE